MPQAYGSKTKSPILHGLRKAEYEAHHKVKITDEALVEPLKKADRYISDRFLSDK